MAQLGSYAQALGQLAKENAASGVKGLAQGMKYAAMRELPALSAGMAFAKDVRGRAAKIEDVKSKEVGKRQAAATENLVRQQATNNVISLDMARQLRQINSGVQSQRFLLNQQVQSARRADQFAEEEARERADYNRKLLKAIEKMGGGPGGGSSSASGAGGGGGFFDSILGAIGANLGDILGAAAAGYGAYKIGKRIPGRAGRGGGGGGRRPPYRDPKTGRFGKRPPSLFRRGLGALGMFGRAVAVNPLSKMTPWGWAASALGLGLSFGPDIYDFFAGSPGGELDVTPEDRQRALSRSFITRFLSGGADRRAQIEAANRLRRQRYQRPTPYAQRDYLLGKQSGRTRFGRATSSSTVPPPANLPGGASSNINDLIIQIESGGNARAQSPTSSAYGLGQFTRGTFNDLAKNAKPGDPLYGKTFSDYASSPALQRAALAKLTESNINQLKSKNIAIDDTAIYLAHFLGPAGAIRVLQAPDNTPISQVVSKQAIKSNAKVFANIKTVGDLKTWAKRKIARAQRDLGTTNPAAASSVASAEGIEKQKKLVDALGKAWTAAYNDPKMTPQAKDVVLKTYESEANRLRLMQESAAGATSSSVASTPVVGGSKGGVTFRPPISVASTTGGGTGVATGAPPVPVVDEEANKRLAKIEKSQGKVEKETRGLSTSSRLAARNFVRRERLSRRVLTPEEEADEYLKKAQQGFLNAFDKTLTKAFKDFGNNFLKSVGYTPGGRTVTAQEASRVGYAGQQLGKALDLDKKTANLLEKVIGKEYGRMLAPAVSELGKAYLNSVAIAVGQGLFKDTVGAQGAKALTGQIIGNFAKGNKQVAMEQLLYGLTGFASGPETIAQSYGFRSAAEGIGYMAEVFAAKSTNAIQGMFGWEDRTQAQQVRDPTTGRLYTPGEGVFGGVAMPDLQRVGYGGMRLPNAPPTTLQTASMTTMIGKQDNLLSTGARTLNGVLLVSVTNAGEFASEDEQFKHQMLQGFTTFATAGVRSVMDGRTPGFNPNAPYPMTGVSPYSLAQGTPDLSLTGGNKYGMVGSEVAYNIETSAYNAKQSYSLLQDGQRIQLGTQGAIVSGTNADVQTQQAVGEAVIQTNQQGFQMVANAIASQPRGGGSPIGGGGFASDFMGFVTNMAVSFVANKLTSKIKSPYVRAIANFGIQYAAQKFVLPSIFGGGAAAGAGAGVAGTAAAGAAGAVGAMSLTQAFGAAGGWSGFGNAALTSMGLGGNGLTLSGFAANTFANMGMMGTSNFFAGMNAAGTAGLTAAGTAGYYVGQALPYAAAIAQLFQGNIKGAATTAALTYIGTAIGGPIGGFIGSVIGSVLGKKKKAPPPKIVDKVLALSDKDIAKKVTVREENGPTDGQRQLADAFLNTAFNTAMSIYQVSKINPPFDAIYISIRNNNLKMALPSGYAGGVIESGWAYEVTMEEKKNAQFYMLEIMRKIREVYKAGSEDPEYLKKIDEGYKLVANKSAAQLAGGLISSLKYGKYAINGREYSFGDTTTNAAQNYVLGSDRGRSMRGATSSAVTVTAASTSTQPGSITPTSGTVTSVNVTPAAARGADGSTGTQNVTVVTDNSTKNVEGSTVNTTYLQASGSADMFGRAGTNTMLPMTLR